MVSDIDNEQTLETQIQTPINQTDGERQLNQTLQDTRMSELDDSQFEDNKTRPKLTRKQKHENGQRHKKVPEYLFSLTDILKEQLQTIQSATSLPGNGHARNKRNVKPKNTLIEQSNILIKQ